MQYNILTLGPLNNLDCEVLSSTFDASFIGLGVVPLDKSTT